MKILRRFLIVLVLGVIAGGATWSFFSDTETSVGNTFAADGLYLEIDSQSHYNGLVCAGSVWDCEPWADVAVEENQGLRRDGTAVVASRSDLGVALGAAESTGSDVDTPVIGSFYSLGFGGTVILKFNNLVLNGENDDIMVYEITGGAYPSETADIEVSQDGINYFFLGTATRDEAFNLDDVSLPWIKYIKLTDTSNPALFPQPQFDDADGYDLDAIKALHCSSDPDLIDDPCDGTWELTNDTESHKFFNFSDIKPGDLGEDTVSLHLDGTDAWGRMIVDVTEDSDNTCVGPEVDPVDPDCPDTNSSGGDGELREHLLFTVWLDEGITPGFQNNKPGDNVVPDPGEGDNRKQESEPELISAGAIDPSQETHNLWEGLDQVYDQHVCTDTDGDTAYGNCHGLAEDGHLVESAVYYFGIGWELPIDTGNDAQTDRFTANMTFEVEQYSNNPNPF